MHIIIVSSPGSKESVNFQCTNTSANQFCGMGCKLSPAVGCLPRLCKALVQFPASPRKDRFSAQKVYSILQTFKESSHQWAWLLPIMKQTYPCNLGCDYVIQRLAYAFNSVVKAMRVPIVQCWLSHFLFCLSSLNFQTYTSTFGLFREQYPINCFMMLAQRLKQTKEPWEEPLKQSGCVR